MRQAWAGSFAAYPTYPMYVEDLYEQQETVIVLGHTSSSHGRLDHLSGHAGKRRFHLS